MSSFISRTSSAQGHQAAGDHAKHDTSHAGDLAGRGAGVAHQYEHARRGSDSEFPPLDECSPPARAPSEFETFESAYDLMFEMVEMLACRTGHLRQELVGFEFRDGTPVPARAVKVEQSDVLGRLMQQMLDRWPVVAHIFQGWTVPDATSDHQRVRCEVIVIALHSHDAACMATCRIDRRLAAHMSESGAREAPSVTLEKGPLRVVARDREGA